MGRNIVIFNFYISLPNQSFDMENISDIKEFNKLFSNYQGIFIRFANTYIQDEETAEDIVIDSLVYYWENRNSLPSNSNIPAYIMEVVKHKSLNYLRNQRIREEIEQNLWDHMDRVRKLKITTLEACDPEELFSAEAQRLIDETLESLPEKTRTIFIMSRYENKTHKEIAAIKNQAHFKTKGGIGYVPITIRQLSGYKKPSLYTKKGNQWIQIDQSTYGNDYWQTDFDPASGTWEITYNIHMDSQHDKSIEREFKFKIEE